MRRDGLEPAQPHYPKIYWAIFTGEYTLIWCSSQNFTLENWSLLSENLNVGGGVQIMFSLFIYQLYFKFSILKQKRNGLNYFTSHFKNSFSQHLWVFASLPWLRGWMADCSRALVTTLPGPINSRSLLEHQVMANSALKLQPGLTVLILPQLELRTSRAHSWVP